MLFFSQINALRGEYEFLFEGESRTYRPTHPSIRALGNTWGWQKTLYETADGFVQVEEVKKRYVQDYLLYLTYVKMRNNAEVDKAKDDELNRGK